MRDLILIAGALVLGMSLLFSTGCNGNSGCCDGQYCPCCPCDPSQCVPGQTCCPGGVCPLPQYSQEVGSIEIGNADTADVNREALNERKDGPGPCANCPSCVVMPPQPAVTCPAVVPSPVETPASPPVEKPATDADADAASVRTGAFRCEGCQRAVVGADWHEMWTDDDTPMTCLCNRCWHRKPAAEKREIMTAYLERSNLPPSSHFYAEQLIGSIR